MRTLTLSLSISFVTLTGCGGGSAPPPPVATPAGLAGDELRPLSSRDQAPAHGGPAHGASPGADAAPGAPQLPAGHPPMGGAADPHGNVASGGATRSAGSVQGTITLAPRFAVGPSDVLYVIARKGSSTLAVRRVDKPTFPFAFELSGADVMMGGVAFEGPLDIVARVSRTGDAIPAKGDIEGTAKEVPVPSRGVQLTVDSVRQ